MPREVPRARRIADQAQRTLSELLMRDVRDPRLKPMTVTHVKVSPDLTHIWAHYTLLNGDSNDPLQREILEEASGYLRGPLGRALRLRVAPRLHFSPDEELERSNRLDELIGLAVREDRARQQAGNTGDEGSHDAGIEDDHGEPDDGGIDDEQRKPDPDDGRDSTAR